MFNPAHRGEHRTKANTDMQGLGALSTQAPTVQPVMGAFPRLFYSETIENHSKILDASFLDFKCDRRYNWRMDANDIRRSRCDWSWLSKVLGPQRDSPHPARNRRKGPERNLATEGKAEEGAHLVDSG